MAKRPIFIPSDAAEGFAREVQVDFKWSPGFSPTQKKKNVVALHEAAKKMGLSPLLEVSTKSERLLGQRLSAFNLKIKTNKGKISVECAFQGSKVFEGGGPYTDLYEKTSLDAKKDRRIKASGELISFNYFGQKWPFDPKTAFYDWLYLSALKPHQAYLKKLYTFKGFTDIEFNPERSINCQAKSCALLVSLLKLDALDEALKSQRNFINTTSSVSFQQNYGVLG